MKHILVTTDFSAESLVAAKAALEQAALIGVDDCKITLLAVLEELAPTSVQFEFALALIDTKGILDESYKKASQKIAELRREHFSAYSGGTKIIQANKAVAEEIVNFALTENANLIVMATHGRTGVKRLLLGSVSEAVLRQTPCPVLLVPIEKK